MKRAKAVDAQTKPARSARRLLFLIVGCTALTFGGVAAAAELFPSGGDTYNKTCAGGPCAFWIQLSDGFADAVNVNVADGSTTGLEEWRLRMPLNRYLAPATQNNCMTEEVKNFLHPEDGARTIGCSNAWQLNLRLGDLNDTFVGAADSSLVMRIFGEDGNDYIRTAKAKDALAGDSGRDLLRSGPGADTLTGNGDDDTLDGGPGADVMDCGDGTDLVQYQGRTSPLTVTLDNIANDGESGESDSIAANCENVEAWNGADKVVGSSGPNRLTGRDGNDALKGGGGNDRLYGGSGKDNLAGDSGNDYLSGEDGDDTITGGNGSDTIYGGAGSDTINVKDGVRDTVFCGAGDYDTVVYDDSGVDEIDIGTCERR